ncbi:MAG TPA: hypothetical protein DEP45_00650 [Armatimonadetes bacterium]|nr:hypothetical protein [Armatimonadota bacterium]
MMDVDGVFRGDYGKTVAPDDFWEDWGGTSVHPEVAATRVAISGWAARAPYDLLLDLHAPSPSAETHAYGVPAPTPELESDRSRLMALIKAAQDCPFSATAGSTVRDPDLIARCTQGAQMAEYAALALCLEFAYHRAAAGSLVGPDSLARLGYAVGAAAARFLAER